MEKTLKESFGPHIASSIYQDDRAYKLLDKKVIKEFSMSGNWASWQEFGREKFVKFWVILETGHAVGFNENTSRGWSFPVKKLTPEQVKKYLAHSKTYEQYYQ